jgi:hypothetical protein
MVSTVNFWVSPTDSWWSLRAFQQVKIIFIVVLNHNLPIFHCVDICTDNARAWWIKQNSWHLGLYQGSGTNLCWWLYFPHCHIHIGGKNSKKNLSKQIKKSIPISLNIFEKIVKIVIFIKFQPLYIYIYLLFYLMKF